MAWWIYLGKVTTPIDIPGRGPVVLVPRYKFEAPMSSVAHLVRLKYVQPLKPHQIPKSEPVKEALPKEGPGASPSGPPKSEEKPKEATSDENSPVVASGAVEIQNQLETTENIAGEEQEKVLLEKGEEEDGEESSMMRRG
jgi:hypothetical protein